MTKKEPILLLLKRLWPHIIFWIALVTAINIIFEFKITRDVLVKGEMVPFTFEVTIIRVLLIGLLFKIILFYLNTGFLLRKFVKTTPDLRYFAVLAFSGCILFFSEQAVVDLYYKVTNRITNGSIRHYLIKVNVLIYLFIAAASLVYYFAKERIYMLKQQALIREEHLKNQLKLLNYQINPHFLFNTLNNFYGLAEERNNPELALGISWLTGLMRYSLYDSYSDMVPLEKEMTYLTDYINLYKLRILKDDNTIINIEVDEHDENCLIAPMVLIPLVENAFKHGINSKYNSYVKIQLTVNKTDIHFEIKNSNYAFKNRNGRDISGIGLNNLRQRLQLLYPGKHILNIQENEDFYFTSLQLNR